MSFRLDVRGLLFYAITPNFTILQVYSGSCMVICQYSVCGEQRSVLLPTRLESWTLKTDVQCVFTSHSTTMCHNMLASRKTANYSWRSVRNKSDTDSVACAYLSYTITYAR